MQDTELITQSSNNSSNQLIIQAKNEQSLFRDRAALIISDLLQQIGFNVDMIRGIAQVCSIIEILPPIGLLAQAKDKLKDFEPVLLTLAKNNCDPSIYLKDIPEEKIEYFINQVIARLEWVKYGNDEPETTNNNVQENNNNENA